MCSHTSLLGLMLQDMPDFSKQKNFFSSLSREQAAMDVEKFALYWLRGRP